MGGHWRRIVAVCIAFLVLVAFLWLGIRLAAEITTVQTSIGTSALAPEEKYFWFSRLQTMKAVIGFTALIVGLISASYAWRAVQRPE